MRLWYMANLLVCVFILTGCEDEKPDAKVQKSVEVSSQSVDSSFLTASWQPEAPNDCTTETVSSSLTIKGVDFEGGIQEGQSIFLNAEGLALMRTDLSVIEQSLGDTDGFLFQDVPVLRFQGSIAGRNVDIKSTMLSLSADRSCIYKISFLIRVQ